jgi:hypothetical protein
MSKVYVQVDVNGECETKYFISSDKSSDYSAVSDMVVTKVKNFDKCLTKNSAQEGLFADQQPHYPSERVSSDMYSYFNPMPNTKAYMYCIRSY